MEWFDLKENNMSETDCGCSKGYASASNSSATSNPTNSVATGSVATNTVSPASNVVVTPPSVVEESVVEKTIYATSPSVPTADAAVKVTTPPIQLKVSDINGFGYDFKVDQVVTQEVKSCGINRKCTPAIDYVPDWAQTTFCADELSFIGYDSSGVVAKFCGDGKYLSHVGDGVFGLVDEIPLKAECLWHNTTTLNGGAAIGDPLCFPHIAITDAEGNLWSQKPKQGQQSILVANGETGEWCQQDIRDGGSYEQGAIDQFEGGIELAGFEASDCLDDGSYRKLGTFKTDLEQFLMIGTKVPCDLYSTDCEQGYKYVMNPISLEDLKAMLDAM